MIEGKLSFIPVSPFHERRLGMSALVPPKTDDFPTEFIPNR